MMNPIIFTIGHSTHAIEHFIGLLDQNDIDVVADVRSTPYSRYNPQFNREELQVKLRDAGISYVFIGKELGARSEDPSCYRDGRVQYAALAKTTTFKLGIGRIRKGVESDHRIALMCAEKDPLDCHRTILVARHLENEGFEIMHILGDGQIETQIAATDRLIKQHKLGNGDLFMSREEVSECAFRKQEERISYVADDRMFGSVVES